MIIISDTSPITSLLAVNQIHLLKELYGLITIPEGVKQELLRVESRRLEIENLLSERWLQIKPIADQELFKKIFADLDQGESEAITLGMELCADLILMDETKGRRMAKSYGLQVTGLLGVLMEAKSKKLIPSVKELLDELIEKVGFYVKQDLYNSVLKATGEYQ
jgi:predicted nucleic acid-binding protein